MVAQSEVPRSTSFDEHVERFWGMVQKTPDGCWLWRGGRSGWHPERGQSPFPLFGTRSAHRIAWTLANGPIPDGFDIHHLCGNKLCVNPAHLQALLHEEHASVETNAAHRWDDTPRGYKQRWLPKEAIK